MTTYYVNEKDGDDRNDGLTPETALYTKVEAMRRMTGHSEKWKVTLEGGTVTIKVLPYPIGGEAT